ncbi:hypothetical protein NL676_031406 [Syzygium grande]|nr:hypothetical protein NL676_031406 [Syzygium grande]
MFQAELLGPAVKGTLNVLKSSSKTPSVQLVVLTSSMAAVVYDGRSTHDVVMDESWFLIQTCAGKITCTHISERNDGMVDVKDVANAHILAFEVSSAGGRYCLFERVAHYSEIVKSLRELYPSLRLPEKRKSDGRDLAKLQRVRKEEEEGAAESEKTRMSATVGEGKVVCVTGASGYIASWLVKLLLRRGYAVNASVRDPNDPKKVEHLLALDGAKDRLRLFKADLLEEGSFDAIVEGCVGFFHTASPFYHNVKDPQAELLDPALKGTLNVLKVVQGKKYVHKCCGSCKFGKWNANFSKCKYATGER